MFKIAKIKPSDGKVYPYFHDNTFEYRENTIYDCVEPFKVNTLYYIGKTEYTVHNAMHSYSLENIRLFVSPCSSLYAGTYKTTPKAYDVIARPQYYHNTSVAVMLCTIPKGTRYAVNSVGEIVSDCIDVVKIIKNPFTFNKDHSVSKKSVEKVNKILDNWEKEYVLVK